MAAFFFDSFLLFLFSTMQDQAHLNPESAIDAAGISNKHTLKALRMTQLENKF